MDDLRRAQAFADRFATLPWVRILSAYARRVNPLMGELLGPMQYYWATAQAEYSTDVLFKSRAVLAQLMPRLIGHSLRSFGANDVMGLLGRKLTGRFEGEMVTDLSEVELKGRLPGQRVKHRMKANGASQPPDPHRQAARMSRLLARLHAYGLVAKVPRSRRWRVTSNGYRLMTAAIHLRDERFPHLHATSAPPEAA